MSRTRITAVEALKIHRLAKTGMQQRAISELVGRSQSSVCRILNRPIPVGAVSTKGRPPRRVVKRRTKRETAPTLAQLEIGPGTRRWLDG